MTDVLSFRSRFGKNGMGPPYIPSKFMLLWGCVVFYSICLCVGFLFSFLLAIAPSKYHLLAIDRAILEKDRFGSEITRCLKIDPINKLTFDMYPGGRYSSLHITWFMMVYIDCFLFILECCLLVLCIDTNVL